MDSVHDVQAATEAVGLRGTVGQRALGEVVADGDDDGAGVGVCHDCLQVSVSPPRCAASGRGSRDQRPRSAGPRALITDRPPEEHGVIPGGTTIHLMPEEAVMMKCLVVFESMFGNTETFARDIADGLASPRGAGLGRGRRQGAPRRSPELRPPGRRGAHACLLAQPAGHPGGRRAPGCRPLPRGAGRAGVAARARRPGRGAVTGRRWRSSTRGSRRYAASPDRLLVAPPGCCAAQGFDLIDRPTSFYVVDLKGPVSPGRAGPGTRPGASGSVATRPESARGA